MNEDKSATVSSPRKALWCVSLRAAPEMRIVVVKLIPPAFRFFPVPHRMAQIVLRYGFREKENLERTFRKGTSYVAVLELNTKGQWRRIRSLMVMLPTSGPHLCFPGPSQATLSRAK